MLRWRRAAAAAVVVRVAQALAIRTAFAPDEYWQSIEVAHRLVFGYGHLTWEWAAGLRSYVHPLLFAAPYALLRLLRLDSTWAVVRTPLLMQALCAAASDVYVVRLAALVLGRHVSRWCLACQLASWFNGYCLVRTYSNSMEALAAAAGTYHWLCSLSVVVRPSSALFWALPAGLELLRQRRSGLRLLLVDACVFAGALLAGALLVDRAAYGRWVAVPWQFVRFNLLAGASVQYGRHPWHWNFSLGVPTVATTLLPLLVMGLLLSRHDGKRQLSLAGLAAWSLVTYSLPAHKEFRFLLPAWQLLVPYCGLATSTLMEGRADCSGPLRKRPTAPATIVHRRAQLARWDHCVAALWRCAAVACLLFQLPLAAYFMLVHQGAQVGIMSLIQAQAHDDPAAASVLFLTPCHATPYFTHVHRPIPMRFLDCSPAQHAAATARLNLASQAWLALPRACQGPDAGAPPPSERQCFERDPAAYLAATLGDIPASQRPRLLVGYAPLMRHMGRRLAGLGYHVRARLTNCWVQTDEDSPCQLELWSLA